jgi:hypothetical protein
LENQTCLILKWWRTGHNLCLVFNGLLPFYFWSSFQMVH